MRTIKPTHHYCIVLVLIMLIITVTGCSKANPAPAEPILKDETLMNNTYLQQIHTILHDPNSRSYRFADEYELPETSNHKQNAEQIRTMLDESRKLVHTGTVVDHITYRVADYMPRPESVITGLLLRSQFICKETGTTDLKLYDLEAPHLYVKDNTLIHVFYEYVPRYPSDDPKTLHTWTRIMRLMAVEYHNVTQLFEDCTRILPTDQY